MTVSKPLPLLLKNVTGQASFSTLVVLLVMVAINVYFQPDFFTPDVLESNLATFTPLILISMAQALVIIVGGIDLSVGATIALLNVIMASLMKSDPGSVWLAVGAGFVVAVVVGLVNGTAFGVLRLPPLLCSGRK